MGLRIDQLTQGNAGIIAPNSDLIEYHDNSLGGSRKLSIKEFGRAASMQWAGDYVPGTTYFENQVTRDGAWTMIANTETDDPPSPVEQGPAVWTLPESPGWTSEILDAAQLITANEYTFAAGGYLRGARVWVPATDPDLFYHVYILDVTDPANPVEYIGAEFEGTLIGWVEVTIQTTIIKVGMVLQVGLITENRGTFSQFSGSWTYSTPNNWAAPGTGEIVHASKNQGTLSIDKNGLGADLLTLKNGDQITGAGVTWAVNGLPTDQGTYVDVPVTPAVQGAAGTETFSFVVYGQQPVAYVDMPDYWLTWPGPGYSATGLYSVDGGDPVTSDTAFGADVLVQEAVLSDDWDLLALSGDVATIGSSVQAHIIRGTAFDDRFLWTEKEALAKGMAGERWMPGPKPSWADVYRVGRFARYATAKTVDLHDQFVVREVHWLETAGIIGPGRPEDILHT